ncbi:hypothetical protein R4I97_00220 [Brachyspira pilosicoli]|uniref:hypothetical protein n=1 Tax=Brachyspira pilosicoli TaxID=52584 RepID=UPI00300457F1
MKKTLLALMLVSSLFVISCGADSTKPSDAYKVQKVEVSSGTIIGSANLSSTTVDVSSFARAGEKVTEIVEVKVGDVIDTVSAIQKNSDGGIYQFNITQSTGYAYIKYKYTKTLMAPMATKTAIVQASSGTATINDPLFLFERNVISVTDAYGNNIPFDYYGTTAIHIDTTITGNLTIKYQYMDIEKISEKPSFEGTISAAQIDLTAANAGKTYVCIANNGGQYEYLYGIVPANGQITLKTVTTSGNYRIWVY